MLEYIVTQEMLDSEKITRKRSVGFVKKLLRFLKYDFYYPSFKRIVYAEELPRTKSEKRLKAIYDSYIYLIDNAKQDLTKEVLNKFLFVMKEDTFSEDEILKIQTAYYYPNEKSVFVKIVEFHFDLYKVLHRFEANEMVIISLMFLNYALLNNDFPSIQLTFKEYKEYERVRENYFKEKEKACEFIYRLVSTQKLQNKDYYNKISKLTKDDIVRVLLQNKEKIKQKYNFKNMFLFGSFASNEVRFDSDIDLLVEFNEGYSLKEKRAFVNEFVNEYQTTFNRFIDIHELGKFVTEDLILTIKETIKIF